MDEHAIRTILEGGGGPGGRLARAVLWLPGKAYGLIMRARRAFYRCGIFRSVTATVPVVSIGNITAGGSGKTPFVIMLARELTAAGHRPAILLRGYRSVDGVSDEAVMYNRACPLVPVYTGSDRSNSARRAVFDGASVILMDDGFQHLRLRRDMDIVLVDATSPWGGCNTIPGGLLREPLSALTAADAVVITRSDQRADAVPAIRQIVGHYVPNAPIFTARHAPARLQTLQGENIPLTELTDKPVVALAGIARPEAFRATLEQLGARVIACFAGNDHGDFAADTVFQAISTANAAGGIVITTEKDRVKSFLRESADNNVDNNMWVLGVEQDVHDKGALLRMVLNRIARASDSSRNT